MAKKTNRSDEDFEREMGRCMDIDEALAKNNAEWEKKLLLTVLIMLIIVIGIN